MRAGRRIGQRAANFTQQNADCLLILGARLDLPQTAFNHGNFAPAAKKILVDVDATEIAKMQTPIHVPVCRCSRFPRRVASSAGVGNPQSQSVGAKSPAVACKYPVVLPEYWTEPQEYVSTYVLVGVLSEEMGSEDLIVPGSSGPCSDIFMQALPGQIGATHLERPGTGSHGHGFAGDNWGLFGERWQAHCLHQTATAAFSSIFRNWKRFVV